MLFVTDVSQRKQMPEARALQLMPSPETKIAPDPPTATN